jgi:hypothetical protein
MYLIPLIMRLLCNNFKIRKLIEGNFNNLRTLLLLGGIIDISGRGTLCPVGAQVRTEMLSFFFFFLSSDFAFYVMHWFSKLFSG